MLIMSNMITSTVSILLTASFPLVILSETPGVFINFLSGSRWSKVFSVVFNISFLISYSRLRSVIICSSRSSFSSWVVISGFWISVSTLAFIAFFRSTEKLLVTFLLYVCNEFAIKIGPNFRFLFLLVTNMCYNITIVLLSRHVPKVALFLFWVFQARYCDTNTSLV